MPLIDELEVTGVLALPSYHQELQIPANSGPGADAKTSGDFCQAQRHLMYSLVGAAMGRHMRCLQTLRPSMYNIDPPVTFRSSSHPRVPPHW